MTADELLKRRAAAVAASDEASRQCVAAVNDLTRYLGTKYIRVNEDGIEVKANGTGTRITEFTVVEAKQLRDLLMELYPPVTETEANAARPMCRDAAWIG